MDAETLYRAANKVEPSLIRVEADQVTYNLHIVMRFELELELLEGRLELADLPEAWNARIADYLGIEVPDDARGVLQDVHWAGGSFGYFPTYSLGNLIAAQIWDAVASGLPDLEGRSPRRARAASRLAARAPLPARRQVHPRRWSSGRWAARSTSAPTCASCASGRPRSTGSSAISSGSRASVGTEGSQVGQHQDARSGGKRPRAAGSSLPLLQMLTVTLIASGIRCQPKRTG